MTPRITQISGLQVVVKTGHDEDEIRARRPPGLVAGDPRLGLRILTRSPIGGSQTRSAWTVLS